MTQSNGASLRDRACALRAEPAAQSQAEPLVPSATVTEIDGAVVLFRVRAGWDWASIFVRPTDEGAEVVAHSSFGTYGYTWINMGSGGWRQFLLSCSREYAMRKLAGNAYDVPLDREEFVAAMREAVTEYEAGVIDAWGIADADQEGRITSCRGALDDDWGWEDVPPDALFWHFNETASGAPYAMELYETRLTKINPQVIGFWETLWMPFCDHLASAMSAEGQDPQGLGAKPASAAPNGGDAQCL